MKPAEKALQRLLKSAAQVPEEQEFSAPFGFDTRIVAQWRASNGNGVNGIARLVRRVAVLAAFVILISSAASYHELQEAQDTVDIASNEYAIADTAIENEFYQ